MQSVPRSLAPLVISGPSAVGKGRLIRTFLQRQGDRFEPCVSYTTRDIRRGERQGVDYNFISVKEFQEVVANKLRRCRVHGNYYGKSAKLFCQIQERGKIPVLDIDVNGAKTVHKLFQGNCLFLLPPSMEVLFQRMDGRGSETEQSKKRRIENGKREIRQARESGIFTYMVCYQQGLSQYSLRYFIRERYGIDYAQLL